MKNRIKIFTFVILLAVFVFTQGNFVRAEAEIKDGSYRFFSCEVKKFQIKNNILTLKMSQGCAVELSKSGVTQFKLHKLKVNVSPKCKYCVGYFVRGTGESGSYKTDYREINDYIDGDRESGLASTVGSSLLKIKNNKVVKIKYFHM